MTSVTSFPHGRWLFNTLNNHKWLRRCLTYFCKIESVVDIGIGFSLLCKPCMYGAIPLRIYSMGRVSVSLRIYYILVVASLSLHKRLCSGLGVSSFLWCVQPYISFLVINEYWNGAYIPQLTMTIWMNVSFFFRSQHNLVWKKSWNIESNSIETLNVCIMPFIVVTRKLVWSSYEMLGMHKKTLIL